MVALSSNAMQESAGIWDGGHRASCAGGMALERKALYRRRGREEAIGRGLEDSEGLGMSHVVQYCPLSPLRLLVSGVMYESPSSRAPRLCHWIGRGGGGYG